ncbi:hypothetical protein HID58_055447, partial [Brassica napus]
FNVSKLESQIPLRFQNLYFWNCDSITLPTAAVSVSNSEPGTVRSETLPCNIERNFSNNGDDSRADNVSSDMHNEKKKGKMKQV